MGVNWGQTPGRRLPWSPAPPGGERAGLTATPTSCCSAWVSRAQDEHDEFAELLASRGTEALLLSDLLTEALHHSGAARMQGIAAAVDAPRLGLLAPRAFGPTCVVSTQAGWRMLTAGMTFNELRRTRGPTCR